MGSYSKKGIVAIPLKCLGPKIPREVVREVHFGDCGSHPRKRRLYKQLLLLGFYWPTMKSDSEELVKTCHACQILGDAIHIHPNVLLDMTTPTFPHLGTWSYRAHKPPIQWLHMDLSNYRVLYKMGRSHTSEKGHWSSRSQLR